MRYFIALALGMLLLVSAAAAQGNDNTATVTVTENTTGMLVTGANIAQISDLDANLLGNNILADQLIDLQMVDSDLVGQGLGRTNAIQTVDLMLNDTGNANVDFQTVGFAQNGNDLTIGNITQMAAQKIDETGNDNLITQGTSALAGVSGALGSPNLLTNSELAQTSIFDATVKGNANDVDQVNDQFATDNDLVGSKLYEQTGINANILGNDNNFGEGLIQQATQIADTNDMTNSLVNEIILLDEQITGNSNGVSQIAETNTTANLLTTSTELQSISAKATELGNGNRVTQDTTLDSEANSAVGGHILQQADIVTNS